VLSENVRAAGETFREFLRSYTKHITAYCRCREVVTLFRSLLT
jgi:hypothetical protein